MSLPKVVVTLGLLASLTGCGGATAGSESNAPVRSSSASLVLGNQSIAELAEIAQAQATRKAEAAALAEAAAVQNEEPVSTPVDDIDQSLYQDTLMAQANLNWQPATTYADGSAMDLSEISHYQVLIGRSADQLQTIRYMTVATLANLVMTDLGAGTWYIGLQTVSIEGGVSDPSNLVAVQL